MRTTRHARWTLPVLLALLQAAPAGMVTFRVGTPPEGALAAGRTVPRSKPPVAYVARAPGALVMDGRLDEPAWCSVRGQMTPEVVRDLGFRRRPRSHESDPFGVDPIALEEAEDFVSDKLAAGRNLLP